MWCQVRAVVPKSAPAPVGPYTPGVFAGDYLYVSGQGAKAPDGSMPADFEAQVRQTLDNVKSVVEAAGLTLDNVVYTQVYLEDIGKFDEMNRVYRTYFPDHASGAGDFGGRETPWNAGRDKRGCNSRFLAKEGCDFGRLRPWRTGVARDSHRRSPVRLRACGDGIARTASFLPTPPSR